MPSPIICILTNAASAHDTFCRLLCTCERKHTRTLARMRRRITGAHARATYFLRFAGGLLAMALEQECILSKSFIFLPPLHFSQVIFFLQSTMKMSFFPRFPHSYPLYSRFFLINHHIFPHNQPITIFK